MQLAATSLSHATILSNRYLHKHNSHFHRVVLLLAFVLFHSLFGRRSRQKADILFPRKREKNSLQNDATEKRLSAFSRTHRPPDRTRTRTCVVQKYRAGKSTKPKITSHKRKIEIAAAAEEKKLRIAERVHCGNRCFLLRVQSLTVYQSAQEENAQVTSRHGSRSVNATSVCACAAEPQADATGGFDRRLLSVANNA